ncbi:stage II sporulation protein P [Aureibacillus halotolerans]
MFGRRWMALLLLSFWGFVSLAGALTAVQSEWRMNAKPLQDYLAPFSGAGLVHMLAMENHYFSQATPTPPPNVQHLTLQAISTLQPEDHRTLLGKELPGFTTFDGDIIVAGEGTDYTTLPIESAPPLEVLEKEREASALALKGEEGPSLSPPLQTTGDRDVVYIYHTHSRESFLPMLPDVTNPNEAFHTEANITLVGKKLGEALEKRGIGTAVNTEDITGQLLANDATYAQSYDFSKPVVKEAIANNDDLTFFFDLHRDALRKKDTTVTINNKAYARTVFVIGGEHARYEENLALAKELNQRLEADYPGLSRGITKKQGPGTNGKFNQDLSPNAILIEFGGVDNTSEELYRTAEAIADVFADYYWEAEKVNTEGGTSE